MTEHIKLTEDDIQGYKDIAEWAKNAEYDDMEEERARISAVTNLPVVGVVQHQRQELGIKLVTAYNAEKSVTLGAHHAIYDLCKRYSSFDAFPIHAFTYLDATDDEFYETSGRFTETIIHWIQEG